MDHVSLSHRPSPRPARAAPFALALVSTLFAAPWLAATARSGPHVPAQHGTTIRIPAAADAYVVDRDPGANHGSDPVAYAGRSGGGTPGFFVHRAVLRFDLGAIPPGAVILDAAVGLELDAGPIAAFDVCRADRAWTEAGVTWSNAPQPASPCSTTTPAGTAGRYVWPAAGLVAAWRGGAPNDGIVLKAVDEGSNNRRAAHAREHPDAASRPWLEVEYLPPSATPGPTTAAPTSPAPTRTPSATASRTATSTATRTPTPTATRSATATGAPPSTDTPSPEPSATGEQPPPRPSDPPPPEGLTCVPSTDAIGMRIDLAWALPEGRYRTRVERFDDGLGAWHQIDVTDEGARTFADRGLDPERLFRYRIRFERVPDGVLSPYSEETACSTRARPLQPAELACESFDEGGAWSIDLRWLHLAPTGLQTHIERRRDGGGPWREIAIAEPDDTTFDDSDVEPRRGYDYRVIARRLDDGARSEPSEAVHCTTHPRPTAPSELSCSAEQLPPAAGGWTLSLAWRDNADDETGYLVERAEISGRFRAIADLDAGATSFVLGGNEAGREHAFRVRAVRDAPAPQLSAPSATATCRTTRPPVPVVFVPGFGGSVLESCASTVFTAPPEDESALEWLGRQFQIETWLARALAASYLTEGVVCSETAAPCVVPLDDGEPLWIGARGIVMALLGMDRYFEALRLQPDGRTARPGIVGPAACVEVPEGRAGLMLREPTIEVPGYTAGGADIYEELLLRLLVGQALELDRTLLVHPYDFRHEIGPASEALGDVLRRAASESPAGQVDVVAHSMGGLVARAFLIAHPEDAPLVRQLVTLGTPYLGTPKAVVGLLAGDNFGIESNASAILELSPDLMRRLARDWPGVYTLAPAAGYFADPERPGWERAYYMETVATAGGATHDVFDHERFQDLVDRRLNASIAAAVRARHGGGLGDMALLTDRVATHQIIGTDKPTIHTVELVAGMRCQPGGGGCLPYAGYRPWLQRAGDGTVTEVSACGTRHLVQDARGRIHKLPGVDHAGLARDDAALDALIAVLRGHDVPGAAVEDCPQTGVGPAPSAVDPVLVDVLGDVVLAVTGPGGAVAGSTGRLEDGWRDEIPGVGVERLPGAAAALIAAPGAYTVTIRGAAPGLATVRLGIPDATGAALATAWTYEVLPIAVTSVATLTVALAAGTTPSVGAMAAAEAPGAAPIVHPPRGPFTGPAANDHRAPRTTIARDGAGRVVLAADDGPDGTGVARILYAVGPTARDLRVYDGPLAVPDSAFVTAVAVDQAGNAEWPPATTLRGRVLLPWAVARH